MMGLTPGLIVFETFFSSPLHGESPFLLHFLCLSKENEAKERAPSAEAFLQFPLQNQSAQPKVGPRLPHFLTVAPSYAGRPGGFPALPEYVLCYVPFYCNFPFLDFYSPKLRPVFPSKA